MANRYERVKIFEGTLNLCRTNKKLCARIVNSINKQKIYWQEEEIELEKPRFEKEAVLVLSDKRSFEAAKEYSKQGKKVCVLNFASSVSPGGGVESGATAQEESLCRISTLYEAINDRDSAGQFYDKHWKMICTQEMGRENRDDCIFTPGVVVLREDTFDCEFLPESEWYSTDVITCAAPDLRYSDFGRIFLPSLEELLVLHEQRWRKILSVAAANQEEVLILGAFGCGAFHNPPEIVVQAFNNIYQEFKHYFEIIEFAVFCPTKEAANYKAFMKIEGINQK